MDDGSDVPTEARRVQRRAKTTATVIISISLVFFFIGGVVLGRFWVTGEDWSPLGPYLVQTVTTSHSGRDGNATVSLRSDHPIVPVTGTKCADPGDYTISGSTSWQSVKPRGTTIITGTGERQAPGEGSDRCVTFEFENEIPPQVLAAMRAQIRRGIDRPLWRIVGVETPTDGDREGVTLSWKTEVFGIEP